MKSMDLIIGVPMLVVSAELKMLECIHGEVGSNHETWWNISNQLEIWMPVDWGFDCELTQDNWDLNTTNLSGLSQPNNSIQGAMIGIEERTLGV